jgi:hypothetical protein
LELHFVYGGEAFDPYESEEEDVLSMLMVRQLTVEVHHAFDAASGVNTLDLTYKA